MANVIEVPHLADTNAYYVWAGVGGPQWGAWQTFASAATTASAIRTPFPTEDWSRAIEAAAKEADKDGVPTVYVARNS